MPAPGPNTTDDTKGKTIHPDIIIHSRGDDNNNLCIIELKKVENTDTDRDFQKLSRLTNNNLGFHYLYGFHLVFGDEAVVEASVYVNGIKNEELTIEFKNLLDI